MPMTSRPPVHIAPSADAHLVLDLLRRLDRTRGPRGQVVVAGLGFGRHAIGGLGSADPSSPAGATSRSGTTDGSGRTAPLSARVRGPRSATGWASPLAVVVRVGQHDRDAGEVVGRARGRRLPLETQRVPRVGGRGLGSMKIDHTKLAMKMRNEAPRRNALTEEKSFSAWRFGAYSNTRRAGRGVRPGTAGRTSG